jgi:hypothetical protein
MLLYSLNESRASMAQNSQASRFEGRLFIDLCILDCRSCELEREGGREGGREQISHVCLIGLKGSSEQYKANSQFLQ